MIHVHFCPHQHIVLCYICTPFSHIIRMIPFVQTHNMYVPDLHDYTAKLASLIGMQFSRVYGLNQLVSLFFNSFPQSGVYVCSIIK